MDIRLPDEMSECRKQHTYFEYLEDHSVETGSKIIGKRRPSKQVVLVYPVLKDEDNNENRSCERSEHAVEGNNVDVNNEEGVGSCEVEFRVLKSLVQLILKSIIKFVRSIIAAI